jgi:hypothetical protein
VQYRKYGLVPYVIYETNTFYSQIQIKLVQVVKILIFIQEVFGSNSGQGIRYPDCVRSLLVFLCLSNKLPGWFLKMGHDFFLAQPFESVTLNAILSELQTASSDKP